VDDQIEHLVHLERIYIHLLLAVRHKELVCEGIKHIFAVPQIHEKLLDRVGSVLVFEFDARVVN